MNKTVLGTIIGAALLGLSKGGSKNKYQLNEQDILPYLKDARTYIDFDDFLNDVDRSYFRTDIRKKKGFNYKELKDEVTGYLHPGEPMIFIAPKIGYAEEFTIPEKVRMESQFLQVLKKGRGEFLGKTGLGERLRELYSKWKDYTPDKNFEKKIVAYHFSPNLFDTFKVIEDRTMGQWLAEGFHFFYHAEDDYHKEVVKDLKDKLVNWYVYTVELNAESIGRARGEAVAWGHSRFQDANESLIFGDDTIFWITMNDTGLAMADEILVSTDDNIKILKIERIIGLGERETVYALKQSKSGSASSGTITLGSLKNKYYHITPTRNLSSIMSTGLVPRIPVDMQGEPQGIYLFRSKEDAEHALGNWFADRNVWGFQGEEGFIPDDGFSLLEIDTNGIMDTNDVDAAPYEIIVTHKIEPRFISIVRQGSASLFIPKKLYHATYGPLVDSIMKQGLGGDRDTVFQDSIRGVVYLAIDPYIAESYAEVGLDNDHVWSRFGDAQIVVFEIDTRQLDQRLFMLDRNVLDNDGSTLEYHGIIPSSVIRMFPQGSKSLDDFDDENKGGDCFEAAGRWIMNNPGTDAVLVHAEVMGRGALQGVWFGHAWIEQGDEVIEVAGGKNARLPKQVYYILGTINQPYYQDGKMNPPKNNVLKYTRTQAMEKLAEFKTWGPWELKTETGY